MSRTKTQRSTSRSSLGKLYKTKISPAVHTLSMELGLDIKVGPTPESVGITARYPKNNIAIYFGNGVIWLRDEMPYNKSAQQLVILHEIGHAIMLYWMPEGTVTNKMQEIHANAAAITMATCLRLPVDHSILSDMARFTKTKGLQLRR